MRRSLPLACLSLLAPSVHGQLVLPWHGDDGSGYISSFQVRKTGTAGRANTLYITNSSNTSDVLLGNTVGLGRAAYFTITNPANTQMALRGDTNGSGMGVFGLNTGTGKGGSFRIINPSNTNAALHGQTNGSGPALYLQAGSGLGADIVGGGLRVTAPNALTVIGGSTLTGSLVVGGPSTFSSDVSIQGFLGLGPVAAPLLTDDRLVLSGAANVGMAISSTDSSFYGYLAGPHRTTTRLTSDGIFRLRQGATDRWYMTQEGSVTMNVNSTLPGQWVVQNGTGSAIDIATNNAGSTNPSLFVASGSLGSALSINRSNAGNSAAAILVAGLAEGPGYRYEGTGHGVLAITQSSTKGSVSAFNGLGSAIVGLNDRTDSASGIASVVGTMDGLSGYGVQGVVTNAAAIGVLGQTTYDGASGTTGVMGQALSGAGFGIGVVGSGSGTSQYGVFSVGRTGATGTKSFVIDHPLDPANKTLSHYCTEGSEPLNAYSGNVTTDSEGKAWVTLPGYIDEINRDYRYQLTVIGTFAQAIVGQKMKAGRFQIRTSEPNVEVSWRLEGVRNDRFVRLHGAPDEQEKPAFQRGKYLSPELYGQDPARGVFYLPPNSAQHRAARPKP